MRHGSHLNPPNRFEKTRYEPDPDDPDWDQEHPAEFSGRAVEFIADTSRSIVSENTSPDIPFRYSINPYRGCAHGCSYCYARPTHEYLGLNAGLDFETRIVVKEQAPRLLREFLASDTWQPEQITFSGVTDCYQPAERQFRLTRQCLEVAKECRQPVSIVTKNALVVRDLDLLTEMAQHRLVHVFLSLTTLHPELARQMEPRTSVPAARLRAISMLRAAGVPVGVMVAPVIPGLNDHEIPTLLKEAADAGAQNANYILLRLPLTVQAVFAEWLYRTQPGKAEKVLSRVQQTRNGQLNSSQWGERMRGTGETADQIRKLFQLFRKKHGLDQALPELDCTQFRSPLPGSGQLRLF